MSRVLVIEDETLLREGVCKGIIKAGYRVDEADTLAAALEHIDAHPPDAIVSDIDLPGRSGLELIGELGRRHLSVPVIFVSGYLNAYRVQIPQHAGIRVLEKPVAIEDLRAALKQSLSGSRSHLNLTPFTLVDFLQLACVGKHSVVLHVQREEDLLGVVTVVDGQLWSATDNEGSGEPAFGRLAFLEDALTRVERLTDDPGPRNITSHWEFVVMEAARRRDEGATFPSEPPSLKLGFWGEDDAASAQAEGNSGASNTSASADSVLEKPKEDSTTKAFNEAFERGIDALLSKQYSQALEAFLDAAGYRPDDPKVVANITRLKELGYEIAAQPYSEQLGSDPEGRS